MSQQIDLESLKNPRHTLADYFKRHKVAHAQIANYVSYSPGRISQWLTGYYKMPPEIEEKLITLVRSMEQ